MPLYRLGTSTLVPLAGVEPASVRPPSGATALTVELQGTYSVVSYGTALAVRRARRTRYGLSERFSGARIPAMDYAAGDGAVLQAHAREVTGASGIFPQIRRKRVGFRITTRFRL